jgi:hypothetical protein
MLTFANVLLLVYMFCSYIICLHICVMLFYTSPPFSNSPSPHFSTFPSSISALVCANNCGVINKAFGSLPSACRRSVSLCGGS